MRLFLLGATGRTGVELTDIALSRGHEVTAFVRSPAKIVRREPSLKVVQGDPRDARDVAKALGAHDVVVSSLGPTVTEATRRTTVLDECAASTLRAMANAGVTRFLVVSSALLFPGGGPIPAFFRFAIRHHLEDARAMEERVRGSQVDWTIARPPRLVLDRDERYRAADGALPPGVPFYRARLSWRAVARFLLDEVDERRFVRKTVGISR
jgi:putative NADH-flavin reductase